MHSGYIKLWRKLYDNPLWKEQRVFSKAEAWIDILMQAQHDDKPVSTLIGYKLIVTNRGDCIKSLETWARRWGWEKTKVSRFLHMLQECNYIVYKNETKTVRITVCNYDTYQGECNGNATKTQRKCNASATHSQSDNNVKNEKNEKKLYGDSVLLSDEEHKKLCDEFGKEYTHRLIDNMNLYAQSKPKKFKEYKSHYATLKAWERRKQENEPNRPQPVFDEKKMGAL